MKGSQCQEKHDNTLQHSGTNAESELVRLLWSSLYELQQELNQQAFLSIKYFDVQLARYPPGTAYHRHADKPKPHPRELNIAIANAHNNSQRIITATYYLNFFYEPKHQGQLRLWLADQQHTRNDHAPECSGTNSDNFVDIDPIGDRMVIFLASLEHQVLLTQSSRYATTAFFYH
jgi:Rps23 Pro-64 3,4-dihydroxylase Tpa1-like proline 4-hydroxylase